MVMINIPENLAKVIEKAAQRENRSLDELALSVLEEHFSVETADTSGDVNALDAILGMFDDDVTDMSSNVKEHLREYYRNKHDKF
jgi:hypothetical protein